MQLSRESLVKGQRIGLKTWAWSFTVDVHSVRGSTLTETAHPPGTMVTISMSCFTTGGPGKEHWTISQHQPGEFRKGQKVTLRVQPLPESFLLASVLAEQVCTTRKDSESERLAKDNTETNHITIKRKIASYRGRAVLRGSSLLLSTHALFPNKISCFVSTCVTSDNSFWVLDKSPLSGPGRGPPFCNNSIIWEANNTDCRAGRCGFETWHDFVVIIIIISSSIFISWDSLVGFTGDIYIIGELVWAGASLEGSLVVLTSSPMILSKQNR